MASNEIMKEGAQKSRIVEMKKLANLNLTRISDSQKRAKNTSLVFAERYSYLLQLCSKMQDWSNL